MGLKWGICFIINILLALSLIIVVAQPSIGQKCGFNRTETYNDLIYSKVKQPNEISTFQNRSSMTIPVVFHIVLTDNPARISDELILSQLNFLNKDFQGSNPDRSKVPDHFKNLVGNSSILFCLASEDPAGKARIGIVRTLTQIEKIGIKNNLYFTSKGGNDAWDTERYLNIWIADTGDHIAGLGSAPGQRNKYEDGVVIHPKLFNLDEPCRTLTHEIGHYLGLFHLWNSDDSCEDNDFVDDTPVQAYPYYDCPREERNTCGTPDMFMNFMDYTNQDCMYFFTKEQVSRMEQILLRHRSQLLHTITQCSPRKNTSDFLVYPNPSRDGNITLQFHDDEPVYLHIQIYSVSGKLIHSHHHWKKKQLKLDYQFILSGIYILAVNGTMKKLVIL